MKNIVRVWIGDPYDGGHFNGTAFFIDEHTLVTAKHVVENKRGELYEDVFLSNTPDGGVTPVFEIVRCERDMAILKVKKAFHIDAVSFSNELSLDDSVNIRGYYDKQSSQKSYRNTVSGYQSSEHTFELQNHLTYGLSGSPVLIDHKICGVTTAINDKKNLTYIIPISELCMEIEFLDKEEIVPKKKNFTLQKIGTIISIVGVIFSIIVFFISVEDESPMPSPSDMNWSIETQSKAKERMGKEYYDAGEMDKSINFYREV